MLRIIDGFYLLSYPVRALVLTLFVAALAVAGGMYIGVSGMPAFMLFVLLGTAVILSLGILSSPFIGLVAVTTLLPITSLVAGLPLGGYAFAFLGAVTVGGYLLQYALRNPHGNVVAPQAEHLFALLFIIWLFVSHPSAALFGGDRTWLFTFVQLGLLLLLTSTLARSRRRQHWIMLAFVVAALISAGSALLDSPLLQQTGVAIREQRASGLTGINTAARYFLLAVVALHYLRQSTRNPALRLAALGGILLLLLGIIATGSRTVYLLLPMALGLLLINRRAKRWKVEMGALILVSVLAIIFVPVSTWDTVTTLFASPSGIDSVSDIRYYLWQAGLAMWQDRPLQGVGIGQYTTLLPLYGAGLLPPDRLQAGAHSIYIGLLAETGLVGLLLFLALSVAALWHLWRASQGQSDTARLAYAWFVMLLLMLLGGLTKHDQYDKLVWFLFGIATVFAARPRPDTHDEPT